MAQSERSSAVTAAMDLATLGAVAQNFKKKSKRWLYDIAIPPKTRVPLPIERSPALYLSAGLLFTTCRNCQLQIPPGTLFLVLASCGIFLKPDGVSLRDVSLLPYRVIEKKEFMRLLFPAFVHRDATHLFFNLNSIIESGLIMEPHMGAAPFLLDVATMTAMSHGFYILISWLEKELLEIPSSYYFYDMIGFSSVAFALNVITGHMSNAQSQSSLPIPVVYHVWVQLAITYLCFPKSSFSGHLSGIMTGLIRVFFPRPFVWLRRCLTQIVGFLTCTKLDNRRDEESRMRNTRTRKQLFHHLGYIVVATVVHIITLKRKSSN